MGVMWRASSTFALRSGLGTRRLLCFSRRTISGVDRSKEPVTPENFFKNANKKSEPGERFMPLALAAGGFAAFMGLIYFKARQHGSVEYFLDGLYFNYNNPRLHNIPKLMPPSPSAHFTMVVDLADLLY